MMRRNLAAAVRPKPLRSLAITPSDRKSPSRLAGIRMNGGAVHKLLERHRRFGVKAWKRHQSSRAEWMSCTRTHEQFSGHFSRKSDRV